MASRNPQTVNLGGGIYTRSQLSQMFRDGRKAFETHLATTPVAVAVEYDNTQRRVVVQLNNGCEMSVPVRLLKEVCDATPKQLSDVAILPEGLAIEWPQLDQQFLVSGLLSDVCAPGMVRKLSRRGEQSKSAEKAEVSLAQGTRRGRRKQKRPTRKIASTSCRPAVRTSRLRDV